MKETLKEIKVLTNNQTFLIDDIEKVNPVIPCMDVYKENFQYDGSIDKLKFTIAPIKDFQNKEMIGKTWYTRTSMRTLKYLLADYAKHKERVHQLDFIG